MEVTDSSESDGMQCLKSGLRRASQTFREEFLTELSEGLYRDALLHQQWQKLVILTVAADQIQAAHPWGTLRRFTNAKRLSSHHLSTIARVRVSGGDREQCPAETIQAIATMADTIKRKALATMDAIARAADSPALTLRDRQSLAGKIQRAIMTFPPGAACLLTNCYIFIFHYRT